MKILILVLSYDDSGIYTEFYKTQKQTWDSLPVEGVDTYYYFGNNNENIIVGNNIFTEVPESLINCGFDASFPSSISVYLLLSVYQFVNYYQ